MDEIAEYIKQLAGNNSWLEIVTDLSNSIDDLNNTALNLDSSIVALTEVMQKFQSPGIPSSNVITVTQPGNTQVNSNAPEHLLDPTLEKLLDGTIKSFAKSGIKTLMRGEGENAAEVFTGTLRKEMAGVAGDFAGKVSTSILTELDADELLTGGISAVVEGVGAALAPEVVIPIVLGAHLINYVGKELFQDTPKSNATSIIPKIQPLTAGRNAAIIQDMLDKGEIEFPQTPSYENGKWSIHKSTVQDFVNGVPTDIDFKSEGALHAFKFMNDPLNLEKGWRYSEQLDMKPTKDAPFSYENVMMESALKWMEKMYLSQGSRGDNYVQREIDNLRSSVANTGYAPYLEKVITRYNDFKKDPSTQAYIQNGYKTYVPETGKGNPTNGNVVINVNSLIDHFDIHVKEMKDSYPLIKEEVQKALGEVFQHH